MPSRIQLGGVAAARTTHAGTNRPLPSGVVVGPRLGARVSLRMSGPVIQRIPGSRRLATESRTAGRGCRGCRSRSMRARSRVSVLARRAVRGPEFCTRAAARAAGAPPASEALPKAARADAPIELPHSPGLPQAAREALGRNRLAQGPARARRPRERTGRRLPRDIRGLRPVRARSSPDRPARPRRRPQAYCLRRTI